MIDRETLAINADEGEGAVAADISANDNDGILTGTTWETTDQKVGPACFRLDGEDDFVSGVSPFGDVDFRSVPFSIGMWVNNESATSHEPLITFGVATGTNYLFNLVYNVDSNRMWAHFHRANNTTTGRTGISAENVDLGGAWHYVEVTHNGGAPSLANTKIYVDTVSVGDDTLLGNWGALQSNVYRIGRSSGTDYFEGLIGPVVGKDGVFTNTERELLWNDGSGVLMDAIVNVPLGDQSEDSSKTFNGSLQAIKRRVSNHSNVLLHSVTLLNAQGAEGYLQFFDVATANEVVLGTTIPKFVIGVDSQKQMHRKFKKPVRFVKGTFVASTTTRDGSTGAIQEATLTYTEG